MVLLYAKIPSHFLFKLRCGEENSVRRGIFRVCNLGLWSSTFKVTFIEIQFFTEV